MEFNSFFETINVEKPSDCFKEIFTDACKEYENSGVFFLQKEFIEYVNSFCDCLSGCYNEILKAATLAQNNKEIALYVLFVYRAMLLREIFKNHLAEFVFPTGKTTEYDFLPLLILIPIIPDIYEKLKKRNLPEDIIKDTLLQFTDCVYLQEERFGKKGLSKRYFDHLQTYVDMRILNIGRLRFEMVDNLVNNVLVLKDKDGKLAILSNGEKINESGMIYGTPPKSENEKFIETFITETEDYYKGFKVSENGRVEKSMEIFSKDDWKPVLKKGDSVLSVHITNKGPLTEEACQKSFERAEIIFRECFPDFKYKAFFCHSWLLDVQLKDFLSLDSNIVKFQERFSLFPGETFGEDVFNFVFKLKFKSFQDMPEDTSLQRKIKKHYLDGKYIYEFSGVFLKE